MTWQIERSTGPARTFHERTFDHLEGPTAWIHHVESPALVLGSTTDAAVLRAPGESRTDIEVCRRRSGGGLVLVEPDDACWIDLLVPRGHQRWDDDVNRSFFWIGDVWAHALAACGVERAEVWTGPLTDRAFGRAVCFAGLGPGEVTVADDRGRRSKVVGLSQRRTRWGARFQGLYVRRWSPSRLAALIDETALPEGLVIDELAIGLPTNGSTSPVPSPSAVERALLRGLE